MSFLMIHPVEEENYSASFNGRAMYHFDRSICEPGTNYFVMARGPAPQAVSLATEQETGLFARRALAASTVFGETACGGTRSGRFKSTLNFQPGSPELR